MFGLRLIKLVAAGRRPWPKGEMVTEKFVALAEATGTIMTGGSLRMVVTRYRALVRAKELRLAK